MATTTFDPVKYKDTTREQWQSAAEAWYRWGPTIDQWLNPATDIMLDMVGIGKGGRVLDIAAGAGGQSLLAARRVGPTGSVMVTDIAPNILTFAEESARLAGIDNIKTRVIDGENIAFQSESFDAVISRVGLIYFPDQHRSLTEMHRVLTPGGRVGAIVYATPDQNRFFSIPISIIRRRAQLPAPLPGQPGPFSLGAPGVLVGAMTKAGFRDIQIQSISAPVRLPSAAEFVHFARESFGALHQMLAALSEAERESTWEEIEQELREFEGPNGFEGPCTVLVAAGVK